MATRSVHVTISGRVQAVGFRAWTERQATARRLSGWVCNRRGGTVEAVFAGGAADVEAMLVAVRAGPPGARVDAVAVSDHPEQPTGTFAVRATY
jgi:acylphosphatase